MVTPARRWKTLLIAALGVAMLVAARLFLINVVPDFFANDAVERWKHARFGLREHPSPDPARPPGLGVPPVENVREGPGLIDGEPSVRIVAAREAEGGAIEVTVIAARPPESLELWIVLRAFDSEGRRIRAVGGEAYGPDGRLYPGSSFPIRIARISELSSTSLMNVKIHLDPAVLPPGARPARVVAELYLDRVLRATSERYPLLEPRP